MANIAFDIPLHQSRTSDEDREAAEHPVTPSIGRRSTGSALLHGDAIQALAEETGGCVSDSLEMARFGANQTATTLVVAGVRFMGETAKILSPDKRVLMPTLEATCSLDLGCPIDEFSAFCGEHPDRTVVVYANTSAAVKARSDWVVTSSIALDVAEHLTSNGEKLIWAPDRYLGGYIERETGADMVLWDGACIVHEEFKANGLIDLKRVHPDAAVLVHPESPESVIAQADIVGSTTQIIKAAKHYRTKNSLSQLIEAFSSRCDKGTASSLSRHPLLARNRRSCAHCPWMGMNTLEDLAGSRYERNHRRPDCGERASAARTHG